MKYTKGWFPRDVVLAYLSYPYSDDPERRTKEVIEIAERLIEGTDARIALIVPHYAFDAFLRKFIDQGDWLFIADWELSTIAHCDIFIHGCELDYGVSPGMVWEAAFARNMGMPVLSVDEAIERYGPCE